MNKKNILAVLCLIISAMAFAQVPHTISYQAVVRAGTGELIREKQIAMRVAIIQGDMYGESVYNEMHYPSTNENGCVVVEIGGGETDGDFSGVDWAQGPYFMKVEIDPNGGDNYSIEAINQMLAVPYSFYAEKAGNVPDVSNFITDETDPTVPTWAKAETKPEYDYSEIQNTPEIPEQQVLSISNDTIFLTNGGFVKLPAATVGFSGDYNDLTNRPEIPTVPTNVSAFENDANYIVTETDPTVPTWAKSENKPTYQYSEIQNTPTAVSTFENDANYLTSYTETQTIADAAALGNSVNAQLKNITDPTENQDAVTKKYLDDIIADMQAELETLQATLAAIKWTITFVANGGSGTMEPQTFNAGVAQAIATNAFIRGDYPFVCWNTSADGGGTTYTNRQEITISENLTLYAQWDTLHKFVDLGLPSGTKWANCNVGAENPEDYGDYFAWGETSPHYSAGGGTISPTWLDGYEDHYAWTNYRYCNSSDTTFTKYCNNEEHGYNGFTDTLTILQASDDAATANWGNVWRMPTTDELQEMIDNCELTWTTQNDVNGMLFTSRSNGNSVFLPATGTYGIIFKDYGSACVYWSNSLLEDGTVDSANALWYYSTDGFALGIFNHYRYVGLPVRAVCQP